MSATPNILSLETKKDFEEAISGKKYAIIEFNAEGDEVSELIETILAGAEEINSPAIQFAKVDFNKKEIRKLAQEYAITPAPTLLFFKDGELTNGVENTSLDGFKFETSTWIRKINKESDDNDN